MNYCPETVLVHSSFLLADTKGQELQGLHKESCHERALIVCETIKEITGGLLWEETCVPLDTEIKMLEFKLHSWVFSSLLRNYMKLEIAEAIDKDFFDTFPPLPKFGITFYLEILKEMHWEHLLVECLYAVGLNNAMPFLDDLVENLVSDPRSGNVFIFLSLFGSLLVTGTETCTLDDITLINNSTDNEKSLSQLLIDGLRSVRKQIQNTAVQLDVLKAIIDFTISTIVNINFGESNRGELHFVSRMDCVQHAAPYCEMNSHSSRQRTFSKTICSEQNVTVTHQVIDVIDTEDYKGNGQHPDLFIPTEVASCIELLSGLIVDDWGDTSHWVQVDSNSRVTPSSAGQIDCDSWHPIHAWIVKLYGVLCLLISHSFDSKLLLQAMKLQCGLAAYITKYATRYEQDWLNAFQRRELIQPSVSREEFSCPCESVDLLLFKPDTAEEQYHFYLKRVDDKLEGGKECFDWLLSAEEFYNESSWLECMQNHALRLSESQQALKMIDIICLQHEYLSAEMITSDKVFRTMKEILFNLFPILLRQSQVEILEYTVTVGIIQDSLDDSIFFHPWLKSEEKKSFQQELVMMFNKLVDVSSDNGLQCAVGNVLRAALIMPHLTIHRLVEEGVKSAGHAKVILQVLQELPFLCGLKIDHQDSTMSLLCSAVKSVTMKELSKQHEINLLNMLAVFLAPSVSNDVPLPPLLNGHEIIETVILPFLTKPDSQKSIPTIRVLKILHTSTEALKEAPSYNSSSLRKHLLPVTLNLCELLDGCTAFWNGLAPDHSLSEVEELKDHVLKVLDSQIQMCFEVLKTNPSFSRVLEWLFRRLKSEFDWTIPLYFEELFSAANIKDKFQIPCCVLTVCKESGDRWMINQDLAYGLEDVFTALFECCRVSASSLKRIQESLMPDKLTVHLIDGRKRLVTSLLQVLVHSTWTEWQRILALCRHLIKTSVLKDFGLEHVQWSLPCNEQDVNRLSALLLEVVEVLQSPASSSWATLHVWFHVTKHYVAAIKELTSENISKLTTAALFAHACHVMTIVPADLTDKLFVLALDLVGRPSISECPVIGQLKLMMLTLPWEVYRAPLMQKLSQSTAS